MNALEYAEAQRARLDAQAVKARRDNAEQAQRAQRHDETRRQQMLDMIDKLIQPFLDAGIFFLVTDGEDEARTIQRTDDKVHVCVSCRRWHQGQPRRYLAHGEREYSWAVTHKAKEIGGPPAGMRHAYQLDGRSIEQQFGEFMADLLLSPGVPDMADNVKPSPSCERRHRPKPSVKRSRKRSSKR